MRRRRFAFRLAFRSGQPHGWQHPRTASLGAAGGEPAHPAQAHHHGAAPGLAVVFSHCAASAQWALPISPVWMPNCPDVGGAHPDQIAVDHPSAPAIRSPGRGPAREWPWQRRSIALTDTFKRRFLLRHLSGQVAGAAGPGLRRGGTFAARPIVALALAPAPRLAGSGRNADTAVEQGFDVVEVGFGVVWPYAIHGHQPATVGGRPGSRRRPR